MNQRGSVMWCRQTHIASPASRPDAGRPGHARSRRCRSGRPPARSWPTRPRAGSGSAPCSGEQPEVVGVAAAEAVAVAHGGGPALGLPAAQSEAGAAPSDCERAAATPHAKPSGQLDTIAHSDARYPAVAMRWRSSPRVRYSRWDGTQAGFDLDADAVFSELTDDLLYHGDLNAALRRLLQQGFRDRARRAAPGPARPAREAARRRRQEELEQPRPRRRLRRDRRGARARSSTWSARRSTTSSRRPGVRRRSAARSSPSSGGRAPHAARPAATRPGRQGQGAAGLRLHLGRGPAALRGADGASCASSSCRATFNQMAGAMQTMSPEDMQRMKDMLADLNQHARQRARGEDTQPTSSEFMAALRRLLPREPADPRRAARGDGPAHGGHAGACSTR